MDATQQSTERLTNGMHFSVSSHKSLCKSSSELVIHLSAISFNEIPIDILVHIFSFVSNRKRNLNNFALTCKQWNKASLEDILWEKYAIRAFNRLTSIDYIYQQQQQQQQREQGEQQQYQEYLKKSKDFEYYSDYEIQCGTSFNKNHQVAGNHHDQNNCHIMINNNNNISGSSSSSSSSISSSNSSSISISNNNNNNNNIKDFNLNDKNTMEHGNYENNRKNYKCCFNKYQKEEENTNNENDEDENDEDENDEDGNNEDDNDGNENNMNCNDDNMNCENNESGNNFDFVEEKRKIENPLSNMGCWSLMDVKRLDLTEKQICMKHILGRSKEDGPKKEFKKFIIESYKRRYEEYVRYRSELKHDIKMIDFLSHFHYGRSGVLLYRIQLFLVYICILSFLPIPFVKLFIDLPTWTWTLCLIPLHVSNFLLLIILIFNICGIKSIWRLEMKYLEQYNHHKNPKILSLMLILILFISSLISLFLILLNIHIVVKPNQYSNNAYDHHHYHHTHNNDKVNGYFSSWHIVLIPIYIIIVMMWILFCSMYALLNYNIILVSFMVNIVAYCITTFVVLLGFVGDLIIHPSLAFIPIEFIFSVISIALIVHILEKLFNDKIWKNLRSINSDWTSCPCMITKSSLISCITSPWFFKLGILSFLISCIICCLTFSLQLVYPLNISIGFLLLSFPWTMISIFSCFLLNECTSSSSSSSSFR